MIPGHKISTTPVIGDFSTIKPPTKLVDTQLGGIGLQDFSQGLQYQTWTMYYENGEIRLKSDISLDDLAIYAIPGVTELSFTFDLNMNVAYCYVTNGTTYLRYYDGTINAYTTLVINYCRNPRMCYDDTRSYNTNNTDIILAYINYETLKLCYRISRDRFLVERELTDVLPNSRLIRVGMSSKWRLQFKMMYI